MENKKSEKAARKSADNSICLYSDSFKINTGKYQGDESVLVAQLWEKLSYLESDQKASKNIEKEDVSDSEVLLIQHEK